MTHYPSLPDRVIDRTELLSLIPYSLSHISRLEAQDKFPQRVRLGEHRVGWVLSEVLRWIEEKKRSRNECRSVIEKPNSNSFRKEK